MLKKVSLIFFLVSLSAAFLVAGCKDGHITFIDPEDPDPANDVCCVPVGDGTVLSCTDGDVWFNAYPL